MQFTRGTSGRACPMAKRSRARLLDCGAVTADQMARGREWQLTIRDRFADAFETVDLLLTPTVPAMRKVIGEDMIGGLHYRAVLSWFTSIVNHALHPAIAMPLAGAPRPAPSVQAIGRMGAEAGLIGFGRELESHGLVAFAPAAVRSG